MWKAEKTQRYINKIVLPNKAVAMYLDTALLIKSIFIKGEVMEHNNNEELNQLREFYEQYKNAKQQTEKPFTNTSSNARLNAEFGITEEEEMSSKFYNFQCIILYAYMDYPAAQQLAQSAQLNQPIQHLINTPIELYESPYMAKLLAPKSSHRHLMGFGVYVQDDIFDELDLELENKIKKYNKPVNNIKEKVSVIRNLKRYKSADKSKSRPYISYTIQNQNAIKSAFPM